MHFISSCACVTMETHHFIIKFHYQYCISGENNFIQFLMYLMFPSILNLLTFELSLDLFKLLLYVWTVIWPFHFWFTCELLLDLLTFALPLTHELALYVWPFKLWPLIFSSPLNHYFVVFSVYMYFNAYHKNVHLTIVCIIKSQSNLKESNF